MSLLKGKRILLGVTGGIAAYKTPYLVRLLKKQGAEVKVVITPSAKDFVTPLTLATVSQEPVVESFIKEENNTIHWNNHVELGLWADLMIIAPATSNTISKMVSAQTDNLLMTIYTSARCPIFVMPAMDLDMYTHFGQQENLKKLKESGHFVMDAAHGELASGLVGTGRMPEPEAIVAFVEKALSQQAPLFGKKVIITAGPTYEPIDPVRFIGNHSSGKMGIALAEQAAGLGATVHLVLGPSALGSTHPFVETIRVQTAQEMYEQVHKRIDSCDIAIMSAAVSDYRPKQRAKQKIKKKTEEMQVELVKNPDILASVGALDKKPFLVGFALETENEVEHALQKANNKNCDLLVLNTLNDDGAGFKTDTNKIRILNRKKVLKTFDLKPKTEVAKDIFDEILSTISNS